jgi:hypothetical protein
MDDAATIFTLQNFGRLLDSVEACIFVWKIFTNLLCTALEENLL